MGPISNAPSFAITDISQLNNISSEKHNKSEILENRKHAIDHIINSISHALSPQFEPGDTVGRLDDKKVIQLNSIELENGEKQYYVKANMEKSQIHNLMNNSSKPWKISDLDTDSSQIDKVVFIFGPDISYDTILSSRRLFTYDTRVENEVHYISCGGGVCFDLGKERLSSDIINNKAHLLNNIILDPEKKSNLIMQLQNCTSNNLNCSNEQAVKICEKFPNFFHSTAIITKAMQVNAHKLANELQKNH
ncbi:Uncharacterised protein [Yersinia frederiksenii]|uniref:Uncharacterized protein n=2 Tax=Yersinia frederiksenii TaxID=29484 RepID=A0A380PTI4_YERFR|nr:hypothetical protein [Yersinia frederiksenii]ATM94884.1 hypothetical protein CRN75_05485 [Yersinia frederiksenii]EEQ15387.1 hypothetical protein yfred0001_36030 [Yersinia frederiksenii ATCC 33641]KGA47097.1 hypothetical protein DJ58_1994 [Yersinia frederiksenii ATCC 33641]CNB47275.1 Uncharacterised protein [Yersinia frederiksenii]SUP76572.1 Uncharacterised protein [Yersinia frederiksenii]